MPTRIDSTFEKLRAAGRKGFIAYITAGDPSLEKTVEIALALEAAGVDILELGVPFSDPLADGATIQAAANRALSAGATLAGVLDTVRAIRARSGLPLVLFTYLNPIYVYGFRRFFEDAEAAGADGILVLDLPPEQVLPDGEFATSGRLQSIQLIAPTTPPERMASICTSAQGFIYYVSREGVTGEQSTLSETIADQVKLIRTMTPLPIAVGFGISTAGQAAEVARHSDAAVVGSAIVRQIEQNAGHDDLAARIAEYVRPLVEAVKSA